MFILFLFPMCMSPGPFLLCFWKPIFLYLFCEQLRSCWILSSPGIHRFLQGSRNFVCWPWWDWSSLGAGLRLCFLAWPCLCCFSPLAWCLGSCVLWEDRGSDDGFRPTSQIRECILSSDSGHVRHCQKSIIVFRTLQDDLGCFVPQHETFHEWEKNLFLLWYNSWEQHQVHLVG